MQRKHTYHQSDKAIKNRFLNIRFIFRFDSLIASLVSWHVSSEYHSCKAFWHIVTQYYRIAYRSHSDVSLKPTNGLEKQIFYFSQISKFLKAYF